MEKKGLITLEYARTVFTERARGLHKGQCGRVLVVAGSKGMAGAAVICGKAAYRAGAGLVSIAIDEELYPIIQTALPEAMCVPREIHRKGISNYDAIAIGPGLGTCGGNVDLISYILAGYDKTVVIDADGLNALSGTGKTGLLAAAKANVIITPHMGEARRLLKGSGAAREWLDDAPYEAGRLRIAEMLMEETKSIVVLKGAGTIVASGDFGAYINTTGNPGMATGGSGDALTGIIAAIAGQTKDPWNSAKAGTFIHGLAGDCAAEAIGEYGMTAMDIADMAAVAIKRVAVAIKRVAG